MKKILAIFAGSFNPMHVGYLNILQKAEKIFGKGNVIVSIGINPSKILDGDITEKCNSANILSSKIDTKVEVYTCFLHEYIEEKENNGYKVILIRGLRNGDDLAYESNQLDYISDFKPDIDAIFIMCDHQYSHISSSAIRQLESFRTGSASKYLI